MTSPDFKHIVVGYQGSPACRTALDRANAIALRARATLHIVSVQVPVVPIGGFGWVAPYEEFRPMEELAQAQVREATDGSDPALEVVPHPLLGNPAAEIVRVAREVGASLVVLGSKKHSTLDRILIGSTAERVVRLASVPCLAAMTPTTSNRILVAADDSPFGEHALVVAAALARATGAALRCLYVMPTLPPEARKSAFRLDAIVPDMLEYLERFVATTREKITDPPAIESVVRTGEVCDEILAEAKSWDADLVVAGSHGHGFVARALLGSTSEYLLRHCPVSVLIAPGKED